LFPIFVLIFFRKCVQKISNLESLDYDIFDGITDACEPRYCICNQVSFGKMIACDNKAVCSLGNSK